MRILGCQACSSPVPSESVWQGRPPGSGLLGPQVPCRGATPHFTSATGLGQGLHSPDLLGLGPGPGLLGGGGGGESLTWSAAWPERPRGSRCGEVVGREKAPWEPVRELPVGQLAVEHWVRGLASCERAPQATEKSGGGPTLGRAGTGPRSSLCTLGGPVGDRPLARRELRSEGQGWGPEGQVPRGSPSRKGRFCRAALWGTAFLLSPHPGTTLPTSYPHCFSPVSGFHPTASCGHAVIRSKVHKRGLSTAHAPQDRASSVPQCIAIDVCAGVYLRLL